MAQLAAELSGRPGSYEDNDHGLLDDTKTMSFGKAERQHRRFCFVLRTRPDSNWSSGWRSKRILSMELVLLCNSSCLTQYSFVGPLTYIYIYTVYIYISIRWKWSLVLFSSSQPNILSSFSFDQGWSDNFERVTCCAEEGTGTPQSWPGISAVPIGIYVYV